MFIDASAIVSILNEESGFEEIVKRVQDYESNIFASPLVRFEAVLALARIYSGKIRPTKKHLEISENAVNSFCNKINAKDVSITPQIGKLAIKTAGRYGKIVGHEAKLNFGDCYAYACAYEYDIRLLYKGNDFSKTDMA